MVCDSRWGRSLERVALSRRSAWRFAMWDVLSLGYHVRSLVFRGGDVPEYIACGR